MECRHGWGWKWVARDLNMTGHRGSLKAIPCPSGKTAKTLDVETGEMILLAPFAMNPDNFYRFQRAEWGDVSRADAKDLAEFNLAISEGRDNGWKPDGGSQ